MNVGDIVWGKGFPGNDMHCTNLRSIAEANGKSFYGPDLSDYEISRIQEGSNYDWAEFIRLMTGKHPGNKMLYVVATFPATNEIEVAYTYDGRSGGRCTLKKKGQADNASAK